MKLLTMQFSPTSCHFIPLRSKYSPEHQVSHRYKTTRKIIGFYILKSTIFCDVTPCSPLSQPTFRRNISPPSSGSNNKSSKIPAWSRLILRHWKWRRHVPPKRQLTFNGLHGVIFQKI
jgi:hypothetical protein